MGVGWSPVYADGPAQGARALYMNGTSDDSLSINWGRTGLEPTTLGFTYMFWWKGAYPDSGGGPACFMKNRANGSTRGSFVMQGYVTPATIFTVRRWRDSLSYDELPLNVSNWHHCAVVDGDTEQRVYIDGVEIVGGTRSLDTSSPWTG